MIKVYVAGAYSGGNIREILGNIRRGTRKCVEVLLAGYAPFCPWLDYQFDFYLREKEKLTMDNYYNYSMAWLEVSDYVLVLENSEHSVGTRMEINRAKELNIPIIYSVKEIQEKEDEIERKSSSKR